MFKVVVDEPRTIGMCDMSPLEIGKIVNSNDYRGCLVMRTASTDYPEVMIIKGNGRAEIGEDRCWTGDIPCEVLVELLPKGSHILLTVI